MSEQEQLMARYRNLLISLARHYVATFELARAIKQSAREADESKQIHGGVISGLHCQSNTIRKRAFALKGVIMEESGQMKKIFQTCNLFTIAKQEFILPK